MRIAVDVSPLSRPRTGVGNYLRGMIAGLAGALGPGEELVAFAPAGGQGGGPRGPPAGRAPARAARRPPLLRLDVPAPTGGSPDDDRVRPRPAALPRVDDPAHAPDGAGEARPRGAGLRPRLRDPAPPRGRARPAPAPARPRRPLPAPARGAAGPGAPRRRAAGVGRAARPRRTRGRAAPLRGGGGRRPPPPRGGGRRRP